MSIPFFIDLSFNSLPGNLSQSFSSLSSMTSMYLQNNQFTGNIDVLANLPLENLKNENSRSSEPAPPPPPGTLPTRKRPNHKSGSGNKPGIGGGGIAGIVISIFIVGAIVALF